MRQRAILGAVLLIGVGVALGATVFRTDIAQATGLAQSVTVDNTSANPVPVREQNLDASGFIRVHEQGTPTVNAQVASSKQNPVLVRDVDNPAFQPFEKLLQLSGSAQQEECETFDAPVGKRLVVEYVSVFVNAASNLDAALVELGTRRIAPGSDEETGLYFLPLTRQVFSQGVWFVGSEDVRVYVGPSEPGAGITFRVKACVHGQASGPSGFSAVVTLSGHLVDLP